MFWTARKLFDTVKAHLLKQNAKSMQGDNCQYRDRKGLACAIGCLIEDDAYDSTMEGLGLGQLMRDHPKALPQVDPKNHDLCTMLRDLQEVHDHNGVRVWEKSIGDIEVQFDNLLNRQAV